MDVHDAESASLILKVWEAEDLGDEPDPGPEMEHIVWRKALRRLEVHSRLCHEKAIVPFRGLPLLLEEQEDGVVGGMMAVGLLQCPERGLTPPTVP